MNPAITAVIINYNQGEFFEDCFLSIKNQSFRDFELIVIDDCSTDDSVQRMQQVLAEHAFPHRLVVNQKNQGICANLNMALRLANGRYFTFIASDDWNENDRFEKMLALATAAGNENKIVYSDCKIVNQDKQLLYPSYLRHFRSDLDAPPQGQVFAELLRGNFIPAMCTLMRREVLLAEGGFDEKLKFEDYDMWLRLSRKYEFIFTAATGGYYRILENSLIRRLGARKFEDLMQMYSKHLDAKGQKGRLVREKLRATCAALYYTNSKRFHEFYNQLQEQGNLNFKLRIIKILKAMGIKGSWFKKL